MATCFIFWADEAVARVLHRISSTFDIRFCGSGCTGKAYQFFRQAQTGVQYHRVLAKPLTQDPLGRQNFELIGQASALGAPHLFSLTYVAAIMGLLTPKSIHFRENCLQDPQGPLASVLTSTMECILSPRFLIG